MLVGAISRGVVTTAICLSALLCESRSPASAETLGQSLRAALAHHPVLGAERHRRNAARSETEIARSGYRPKVSASGDIGAARGPRGLDAGSGAASINGTQTGGDGFGARWGYGLSVEQSLFDGFRTDSSVAKAGEGVKAAGQQVVVAEQNVLLEAAAAYTAVHRDRAIRSLRRANLQTLRQEQQAVRERLARSESSRTDLAQVTARLEQAIGDLAVSDANVRASEAEFERSIGRKPGRLTAPQAPEALLPRTLAAAHALSASENPATLAAIHRESAARLAIDVARADGLPDVRLRGGLSGDRGFSDGDRVRDDASVSLRVVVPLYDGGATTARMARARHVRAALAEDARAISEQVHAAVAAAWSRHVGGRKRLTADRRATSANAEALEGISEEVRHGQRSLTDKLDAQRELLASRVRLQSSGHDLVVSAFAVLAATGQLTLSRYAGTPDTKSNRGARRSHNEPSHTRVEADDSFWSAVTIDERPVR